MNDRSSTIYDDMADHLVLLRQSVEQSEPPLGGLFERGSPICVARAPGRLDVMGGIADYSGSLVLQLPIAEAAFAAVQQVRQKGIVVVSLAEGGGRRVHVAEGQWCELRHASYVAARQMLNRDPATAWAVCILGPVLVLLRETRSTLSGGMRILIDSRVPAGKGVSSSAAVEVATAMAFAALADMKLPGDELARLCQLAENHIAGAPCGIMDQMTAALGRAGELLALRCQPASVEGYVQIPPGIAFWGIDSGLSHAVSGSDYTSVRCGAFMGYRMIAEAAGLRTRPLHDGADVVEIDDTLWNGYLANFTPAEFDRRFAAAIPEKIEGDEFLQRFGGTTDRVTRVEPARIYSVLQPTRHPIEENQRVARFRALLDKGSMDEDSLRELGALMAASHASYSACGLGSEGTDLLVRLVHEAGAAAGLFGAKITGGGSGGSVAVLGRADADEAVAAVAQRYEEISGRPAHVFRGSSPGSCATGVAKFTI